MNQSRAQKKAEMEKAAAEMIETLLDWEEENEAPNLREIEDELLRLRKQFGQVLASRVLEHQEASQPIENPACPKCGGTDAVQREETHDGGEPVGRTGDKARLLLLCPL